MIRRRLQVLVLLLACGTPVAAWAQAAPSAPDAVAATAAEPSKLSITLGGTATTMRGDCQEDCPAHGTGAYLHTGSVFGIAGYQLNRQMDAGGEVSFVPAILKTGEHARSTFILGAAQFKPWATRGLFLKAGIGMAFVRNLSYGASGEFPPVTSKALGLAYGVGWTFRQSHRVGLQILGAQYVAAMGDFQVGGTTINDVVANFWSIGAGIVIR